MEEKGYQVIPIVEDVWAIQDGNVRMYLVDGKTAAILIDTGYGSGDLKSVVEQLVKGPVTVVNTHSHGDHASGNRQFQRFVMSVQDMADIRPACPADAEIQCVEDGDIIQAGEVKLEVISIPGHTPGSIALLDRAHRLLFSADSVAKNFPIYMQFPGQDVANYLASLRKLKSLTGSYDRICPCHGELEVEKEYLDRTIGCCEGILNGSIPAGTAPLADGGEDRAYWYEGVAIFH